ncbi:taurine dioxygenase [Novosphingobium endophyticum]|uniref:Taurine dioxygenase n=1 Tax=Novosphingobium endophyticum TaxID=1955250 RepID=A0A916TT33_9SPHN|nr:TauD/TfdA family dioxygenase [Novosphingobium endophyticum]GGC03467.1 taurine dioxygenase [Novosphingobium endophyticum]
MLTEDAVAAGDARLTTRPLTAGFGAEIVGVDLTAPLDEGTAAAIRQVWIDKGLLLFRSAANDDEAQMRLSRLFGEMEPAATADMNDPDNKFMMTLAYDPEDNAPRFQQHYNVGGIDRAGWLGWHWDQSFMPTIVRGAVLRMAEPASEMGETGFIDAIEAYDRLSPALKQRIENLEVVYQFNPDFASGQYGFPKDITALPRERVSSEPGYDFPPVVHPMVIVQRETGRKVLKLSPMHARYILGMEKAESDALLTEVAEHLVDPAFAYFHEWQKNDMVVWDNWRIIHGANGVPLHCKRLARRTTIMGDYKVGRYLDPTLDRDREVKRLID